MTDLGLVVGEITTFVQPDPDTLNRMTPAEIRDAYRDVCSGQVSEEEALNRIIRVYAGGSLTADDAIGSLSSTLELFRLGRDREGLLLSRLVLAAADATSARLGDRLYDAASTLFVLCGSYVLHRMLAGPLYLAVSRLADTKLAYARQTGDRRQLLDAVHLAADVRICLSQEGCSLDWWSNPWSWRNSLRGSIAGDILDSPNEEVLRIPDVLSELRKHQELLRELATLEAPSVRSSTLSDLVHVSRVLGEHSHIPRVDLVAMAREAVDSSTSDNGRARALQLLDHVGAVRDQDRDRPVFTGSLDAEHREAGSAAAVSTYRTVAWLAMRLGRHQEAQALTEAYLQLDVDDAPEDEWLQALDVAVHCFDGRAAVCEATEQKGSDLSTVLADTAPELSLLDQVTARMHAALHSPDLTAADSILIRAREWGRLPQAPVLLRLHRYTRATVALRYAVRTTETADDVQPRTLDAAVEALRLHADLGAPLRAGVCADLLSRLLIFRPEYAPQALWALVPVLDRVLAICGEVVDANVARLGQVIAEPLRGMDQDNSIRLAFYHSQLFKGLRNAAVVRNAGPHAPIATEVSADEQVHRLEEDVWENRAAFAQPTVDDELMAVLHVTRAERLSGRSAFDRLLNARFRADMFSRARLYKERLDVDIRRSVAERTRIPAGPHGRLVSYGELKTVLGERSVLVDIFEANMLNGATGQYIATYSPWHSFIQTAGFPPGRHAFSLHDPRHPGRWLTGPGSAPFVAELRRLILEDPGTRRPVTREAAEMLRSFPIFTLNQQDALPRYASRGCDHVCLWAHGPAHYAPLHLFDLDGAPLAENWLTTSISTPASLAPRLATSDDPPRAERSVPLLSASSPDGGLAAGFPSVPELATQAASVAEALPGSVLLSPDQATPSSILSLLPLCRYAHLAAHGSAEPYAPSFQTLHFTEQAGGGQRGGLTARQLARTDLRNVDLVTLSACETAIGRFDRLDTQSGLTAALLGAGVTAVVSCLWKVRPAPSNTFFTTLYQALAQHGDLRAAYRTAQLVTRQAHPAYRDWGAFVYTGGW